MFDADKQSSFMCNDNSCREAEYEQTQSFDLIFQSGQRYHRDAFTSRIFVNDNDPFNGDVFQIQGNVGIPIPATNGDVTAEALNFFNFEIYDESLSMLNSLKLPKDESFFAKSSDDFASFAFDVKSGSTAIGKLQSITITPVGEKDTNPDKVLDDLEQETQDEQEQNQQQELECGEGQILQNGECTYIMNEFDVDVEIAVSHNFLDAGGFFNYTWATEEYLVTVVNTGHAVAKNVKLVGDVKTVGGMFEYPLQFDGGRLDLFDYKDKIIENFNSKQEYELDDITEADCIISSPYGTNILCHLGDLPPNEPKTLIVFVSLENAFDKTLETIFESSTITQETRYDNNSWETFDPVTITLSDWFLDYHVFPKYRYHTFSNFQFWISTSESTVCEFCGMRSYEFDPNYCKFCGAGDNPPKLGKCSACDMTTELDNEVCKFCGTIAKKIPSTTQCPSCNNYSDPRHPCDYCDYEAGTLIDSTCTGCEMNLHINDGNCIYCGETYESKKPFVPPDWFKKNAKWFSEGQISDEDMVNGIGNLIEQEIITFGTINEESTSTFSEQHQSTIPDYTKTVFEYWNAGQITDEEVGNHIQYLIEIGVIDSSKIRELKKQFSIPLIVNPESWDLALQAQLSDRNALSELLKVKNFEGRIFDEKSDYLWNRYAETKDPLIIEAAQKADFLKDESKKDASKIVETLKEIDESIEKIESIPQIDKERLDKIKSDYEYSGGLSFNDYLEQNSDTVNLLNNAYDNIEKTMENSKQMKCEYFLPSTDYTRPLVCPREYFYAAAWDSVTDVMRSINDFSVNPKTPEMIVVGDEKLERSYSFINYGFKDGQHISNLIILTPSKELNLPTSDNVIRFKIGQVGNDLLNPNVSYYYEELDNKDTIMDELENNLVIS